MIAFSLSTRCVEPIMGILITPNMGLFAATETPRRTASVTRRFAYLIFLKYPTQAIGWNGFWLLSWEVLKWNGGLPNTPEHLEIFIHTSVACLCVHMCRVTLNSRVSEVAVLLLSWCIQVLANSFCDCVYMQSIFHLRSRFWFLNIRNNPFTWVSKQSYSCIHGNCHQLGYANQNNVVTRWASSLLLHIQNQQ